jgi:hypothetical protein
MVSHLFAMPAIVSLLLKHILKEKTPNESEILVKTKTVNRELDVNFLTALHVLGNSLVETIELKENNSI